MKMLWENVQKCFDENQPDFDILKICDESLLLIPVKSELNAHLVICSPEFVEKLKKELDVKTIITVGSKVS